MPRWLRIALMVAGGVAAAIAAIVFIALWATSGIVEPVERQLAALKAGNMDAAYSETSEAFRQETPLDEFTTFVGQYPILREHASYSFANRSINNGVGELTGSLTSATGGVTPVQYRLVKENDAWKIIYINIGGQGG